MSQILFDPRTVAREIPGVFDVVFPQLTPGVVAHFNRYSSYVDAKPVESSLLDASDLKPAMLAELGFALGEKRIVGEEDNWDKCLKSAVERQKRHFDALIPTKLTEADKVAADALATSLVSMLQTMASEVGGVPTRAPKIPGFQWIATGAGDFAMDSVLIEVKFGSKSFSSADYRQVVIYWLLDYLASIERGAPTWAYFVLLNPRLGKSVRVKYDSFLSMISAGRTVVEIAQIFATTVSTRGEKN